MLLRVGPSLGWRAPPLSAGLVSDTPSHRLTNLSGGVVLPLDVDYTSTLGLGVLTTLLFVLAGEDHSGGFKFVCQAAERCFWCA